MLQKWCNNFHINCRKTFWTLTNCPLRFVTLDFTRKKVQSLFFIRKIVFFFRKVLFNNLLDSLNFALITSAVKVKIPRGLLQSVLWDLSYSITRLYEKKAKIFFSLERLPFFSKIYVFKKPLRRYRNVILTSTVIVRIPSVPLQTVLWGLSHSIIQEKTGQITFLLERLLFFSKICFQQPLRFSKLCSNYFRSDSQITSWTLKKCSLRFVILDKTRKRPKPFLHWKDCFFFKTMCFRTTS